MESTSQSEKDTATVIKALMGIYHKKADRQTGMTWA
jgi:hypothetical protein